MRIVASFTPSLGTLRVWRNDVVKLFHAETFWACGFVPCHSFSCPCCNESMARAHCYILPSPVASS